VKPESIKRDSAYYYGVGSGATLADAVDAAERDLISDAMNATQGSGGAMLGTIEISPETAKAVNLPELKPVAKKKEGGSFTVALRMKTADWDKFEGEREASLRADIGAKLDSLKADGRGAIAEQIAQANALGSRLRREGLYGILTERGLGSALLSKSIEEYCRVRAGGISFSASPEGGFVGNETGFTVSAFQRDGSPAASLPVKITWSAAGAPALSIGAVTDSEGKLSLDFPSGEGFRDAAVRLSAGTDLLQAVPEVAALRDIDRKTKAEFRFRHFSDLRGFFLREAAVPGGAYAVGALARDKRAAKKEARRDEQLGDFSIGAYLVTNAQYGVYLEDVKSDSYPEYWDNPDYNQPGQPVVGVSLAQAQAYAAWLSDKIGAGMRLPSEGEWEKAARGGQDAIYPWGDQLPSDGIRANYSGNGRFKATSPVGSFENGKNAYGLYDMAGNVWQWTLAKRDADGDGIEESSIVKGGSWMDGQTELRVSNRRELDPSKPYADVGFRLVREVSHE
jgi:hypothetical protein